MIKRFIILTTLCLCFLTGCAAHEYNVTFEQDGSSKVSNGVYFSDQFFEGYRTTPDRFYGNTTPKNGSRREDRIIDGKNYYGMIYDKQFTTVDALAHYSSDPMDTQGLPSSCAFTYNEFIEDGIVYLQINSTTVDYEQFTEELSRYNSAGNVPNLEGLVDLSVSYKFPYGVRDVFGLPEEYYIRNSDTITVTALTDKMYDFSIVGALREATPAELARNTEGTMANFEPAKEYNGQFKDVPYYEWYSEAVRYVYSCGLIDGKGEHTFAPNDYLTVAETIALVDRVYSMYYDELIHPVKCVDWYDTYVAYAMQHSIIDGTEFSDYNAPITREQAAYLMARAIHKDDLPVIRSYITFTDCPYNVDVELLYRAGVINGMTETTFEPNSHLTRAQAATLIYKLICPSARGN